MVYILGCFIVIISYGLGSIPFGLLLARYVGVDITAHGSGNIGATNVLRVCGKKLGLLTFLLDALKGVLAVGIARGLTDGLEVPALAGIAVVIGHIFPVWLQFKGGKGVATTFAVYAMLYFPLFIVAVLCWGVVFYLGRISSLAALVTLCSTLVVAWVYTSVPVGLAVLAMNSLVLFRHKDNIIRLLKSEEMPLR